jgi:hypothetical protein
VTCKVKRRKEETRERQREGKTGRGGGGSRMQCTPVCGREQMGWEGEKSVLEKDRNGRKGKGRKVEPYRTVS